MDDASRNETPTVKRQRVRRSMQRVTMTDVAERAEVSPSTVSLYIRKPDAVMPARGKAIERAIRALNYVPNMVAGGLAAATSRIVSVIVPSVRNAFFAETVAALQNELGRAGIQVLLGHAEYNPDTEEELVRAALSWSPAAIVLTGLSHSSTTRATPAGSSDTDRRNLGTGEHTPDRHGRWFSPRRGWRFGGPAPPSARHAASGVCWCANAGRLACRTACKGVSLGRRKSRFRSGGHPEPSVYGKRSSGSNAACPGPRSLARYRWHCLFQRSCRARSTVRVPTSQDSRS